MYFIYDGNLPVVIILMVFHAGRPARSAGGGAYEIPGDLLGRIQPSARRRVLVPAIIPAVGAKK